MGCALTRVVRSFMWRIVTSMAEEAGHRPRPPLVHWPVQKLQGPLRA